MAKLKDSGERREFETGAVRDIVEGKGRCDLLPLTCINELFENDSDVSLYLLQQIEDYQLTGDTNYLLLAAKDFIQDHFIDTADALIELSKHFEDGARKYSENNWRKGMPCYIYIDSAIRHYIKFVCGWDDEPHDRAVLWNILCCVWTANNFPDLNYKKVEK